MTLERRPVVTVYLDGDQSAVHVAPPNPTASEVDVDATAPGIHGPQMCGEEVERRDRGILLSRELGTSFGIINLVLHNEVRAARTQRDLPLTEDFIEIEEET